MAALMLAACEPREPAVDTVQLPAPAPASPPASPSTAAIWSAASDAASMPESAAQAGHALAAYLRGAEIQAETDGQRRELRRALADALTLPAAGLRAARYAGDDGTPAQHDLAQMLQGHVVPASPGRIDAAQLLAGRDTAEGAGALRDTLAALDRAAVK